MPFSISFLDEPIFYDEGTPFASGELVLGEHREGFHANLFQWSKQDYEAQWQRAINTLLEKSKSALMVSYVSPEFADNFEWWPMYKIGDLVYFQNHLPWYNQMPKPLSLENISSSVKDRITIADNGSSISEWSIKLSEVEDFARKLHT